MLSTGAGFEMRQILGIAVPSGMVGVTFFGLFLTPVFHSTIRWFSDKKGPQQPPDHDGTGHARPESAAGPAH